MADINIDSVIPYLTIGAISVVTVFFTFYYYYVKIDFIKKYRNYLLTCFLYILLKEFILVPKYTKTPLLLYLLGECMLWLNFIVYVGFIYTTIDFKEKKKIFKKISDISQIVLAIGFIAYAAIQIFFSEYASYYEAVYIIISIYMLAVSFVFLKFLYKSRVIIYYRYLYMGSAFLLLFNIIAAFYDSPEKNFYGLTNLSFICVGWFLEVTMFLIALSIKAKQEWENKYQIIEQNAEIEKKLLLQEIESQYTVYKSKQAERLKISIDIHDGISNAITGLKFYISDKRIQSKDIQEKALLEDIEQELNSIYIQVRNYIKKLHSGGGEENYNIVLFLELLQEQYKSSQLTIITDIDKNRINKSLTIYQQNELYFILNECIGNALKHSIADEIHIFIAFEKGFCCFTIQDNGIGFNFTKELNSGLGLSNILQRIKKLGGSIRFESSEKGTSIVGEFPHFK